jgi:hypothetical protein
MNRMHPSSLGGSVKAAASAVVIALLACGAAPAHAADAQGGIPGEWLMNYAGARTLGLGGAFVATADDALGILWNPAGLQAMEQNQLMFENVRLFEDTQMNSFGFALPGSRLPSFGLSIVSLQSGDFERTNELNDNLGSFHEGETAYLFTMAKNLTPRLSLGTNFKLVQQTVEDFSSNGFGIDLGAIYQFTPNLRIGATMLNLAGPSIRLRDTPEDYPMQVRGGFALKVLNGRGLVSAQIDKSSDAAVSLHAGTEYWLMPQMALRAGYDDDRATGGLSYRFGPAYQIDYGVADHPLGLSHRIGISYRFGGFFASSQADPAVFSPTGEKATTMIQLNARSKAEVDNWSLELINKSGNAVRRFGGPGAPPAHVLWDGKDETGLPVADGVYTYRLNITDKAGHQLASAIHRVEISTGGPQGSVPVTTVP